ncbi:sulfite reductase flavoprotein subunit alpha [Gallaecimonas mangrovi]|uniref:sulfite reductase flavoprotein subunit alpha n=1 Tax=Gallaecimonas mangrovi TaxID=2291597 RepID=UPI000E200C26|nr:sulfite reductase flavoprotein subunit alpha [Gallaecimonas mangrovi]
MSSKLWSQRISFRLHQWLGLACCAVFLVVGLTGAILALEEPVTRAWPEPNIDSSQRPLPMPALASALALPGKKLYRIYAPQSQGLAGQAFYLDAKTQQPYWRTFAPASGKLLGARPGIVRFFATVRSIHRWLLLPHSIGSVITSTAALLGIVLLLAGIVRRAPDRLLSVKDWLFWKKGSAGRHRLWQFHALVGTWCFIPLLIMTLTGPRFGFHWYRQALEGLLASPSAALPAKLHSTTPGLNLTAIWQQYLRLHPKGDYVRWQLPQQSGEVVSVRYLGPNAPHSHAYSTASFDAGSGQLLAASAYRNLKGGDKLLADLYALHTGLYFGWFGYLIWSLCALAFASFAVTGVWLFLVRRARPKDKVAGKAQLLITYASQSGTAAACGQRIKGWLDSEGIHSHFTAMTSLQPSQLAHYQQVLVLAATYGEGEAPDSAQAFRTQFAASEHSLAGLEVAVLAFGDSQYQHFCAFGHWLGERFTGLGATLMMPVTEVDRGAEHAIDDWRQRLAGVLSVNADSQHDWQTGQVMANRCLNRGSLREVHDVHIALAGDYCAGDLLEVLPEQSLSTIAARLRALGLDPDAKIQFAGQALALGEAITRYLTFAPIKGLSPQQLVDSLQPLAPRCYSIASSQGPVRLMVRRVISADGQAGLASGLLSDAVAGQTLKVRLRSHPGFQLADSTTPLIMLGAGTGLAPFLGFLDQAKLQGSKAPRWLIFGERSQAHDHYYRHELTTFLTDGTLNRLDFAWSRDEGRYVQDVLAGQAALLHQYLEAGAHIYVCGSLDGIGAGVQQCLETVLGQPFVAALLAAGRYHRDLY